MFIFVCHFVVAHIAFVNLVASRLLKMQLEEVGINWNSMSLTVTIESSNQLENRWDEILF